MTKYRMCIFVNEVRSSGASCFSRELGWQRVTSHPSPKGPERPPFGTSINHINRHSQLSATGLDPNYSRRGGFDQKTILQP
eukprot:2764467-Pyramimonas_sp.AAC.2